MSEKEIDAMVYNKHLEIIKGVVAPAIMTENYLQAYREGIKDTIQKMIKSAKLSGWVARDENGSLHLFEVEPRRLEKEHRWWDRDYHSTTLDNKDFPDLEWENEPVYIKLPIIVED